MKILVGCEYSGIVRDAFIALGHDAISCDILDTESSGPHIKGDIFDAVRSGDWDIIIIHPPCTALTVSGNRWYGNGCPDNQKRIEAIEWTVKLWEEVRKKSTSRRGYGKPGRCVAVQAYAVYPAVAVWARRD